MVVLLILAILLAIAIPTFLGVTKSANDRAAQSNLNTALVNAKAYYESASQTYGSGTAAANTTAVISALSSAQPALSFTTGASTAQNLISVSVSADGQSIMLAGQAKSTNNCWYILDQSTNELGTGGVAPYSTLVGYTGAAFISGANILAGTWYGESKNASTCSASAPTTYASGSTLFQGTGFPAL
jgi:type IV pilus assembly protein PilA